MEEHTNNEKKKHEDHHEEKEHVDHHEEKEHADHHEEKEHADHHEEKKQVDHHEEKKHEDHHKEKKPITKKNNWKIASFVMGLILIISLGFNTAGLSSISGDAVAENAIEFINTELLQGQTPATLEDVTTENGLIKAMINVQGQATPIYISNDGELLFLQAVPLGETTPKQSPPAQEQPKPQDVPKSDIPIVETFIMSHCPYGTQIEKGILPVANLLGDAIDFNIKFVYYAMHPTQGEVEEQLNQYCIQEEQNDKFLTYLECFLEKGDGEGCLESTEIDITALTECTIKTDEEFSITANLEDESLWLNGRFPLFNIHKTENELYGVKGSPALVINGQTVQSGRDSVSLLNAICNAFNVAPEECNTEFEAVAPGPGFGWDSTGASNNAAACGG
ncbi:DUF4779 domain-containing protein [Candidatus Woesearchaeota archaeon]|nr:DUF4779 domain-containing protein [Candidatus Woesearchaeota archaeon]MBT6734778.1 DUF4779 domain-containing protein [Candidatus Woesearchaeota archaeon]MBT7170039.1 DUF4779 domain-containing protein [Candidatus Woesearchaeota archaeon]